MFTYRVINEHSALIELGAKEIPIAVSSITANEFPSTLEYLLNYGGIIKLSRDDIEEILQDNSCKKGQFGIICYEKASKSFESADTLKWIGDNHPRSLCAFVEGDTTLSDAEKIVNKIKDTINPENLFLGPAGEVPTDIVKVYLLAF